MNKHMCKQRVKFEDLKVALNFLDAGHFMFLFDIYSGYHHVEIFSPYQCFLGFSGITRVRLEIFASESFSLTFLQPLISLLKIFDLFSPTGGNRASILWCILMKGKGRLLHIRLLRIVAQKLKGFLSVGFFSNSEKSLWVPTPIIDWLGLTIDLSRGRKSSGLYPKLFRFWKLVGTSIYLCSPLLQRN